MELKGEVVKHLSDKDKKIKKDTLKKMDDTRKKDDIILRDKINKKINWLESNEAKAIIQIEDVCTSLNLLEKKLERIRGAKLVLQELIK